MAASLPQGVVFDCDGTLADTESLSDRAWTETLAGYGYQPTREDFRAVIGHPYAQNWAHFAAKVDLGDPAAFRSELRSRFTRLVEHDLEVCSDAVDTVRQLAAAGVPVGVASSSSRRHVTHVLERAGLTALVQVVVGADDVTHHKPDPEPYLLAAARLEVAPEEAVAVEDTAVGVASAQVAGMFVVAVVRGHHGPEELAAADRVVDRIALEALLPSRG